MPSLQIGLCGVSVSHPPPLSQLPKVTAQILAQCLKKRRDPLRGQAYQELSAHGGAMSSPQKGQGFPSSCRSQGMLFPTPYRPG